jgi:hypothetical protein
VTAGEEGKEDSRSEGKRGVSSRAVKGQSEGKSEE